TPEHIAGHLRNVLTAENIPFEEPALWLLARAADGSMRDALSLTDQAIAFGNQKLAASDVSNMLGTIDQRDIERIVDTLVEGDGPGLLAEINRISDFAPDYSVILADLLSLFHRVTMEQVVPGSADNALGDAEQVQALARKLSAEDAQLFYQSALMGRKDLAITPDARMGFEMTLLRMLAFRPGADRREPPAVGSGDKSTAAEPRDEPDPAPAAKPQPPAAEPAAAKPAAPEPEAARPQAQVAEVDDAWLASLDAQAESADPYDDALTGADVAPMAEATAQQTVPEPESAPEPESKPEPVAAQEPVVQPTPEPAQAPPSEEPSAPVHASAESDEPESGEFVWHRDFRSLGIVGMPGNLASYSAMNRKGETVVLTIDEGHARLLNSRHEEKILAALRNRFGDAIQLRVEQGNPGPDTPAAYEERRRQERQQAAEASIRRDPVVQSIVERFEARVVEDSIRPADPGQKQAGDKA
ncbi:MAG: DNA polymerase III subunit gamma/tau C-terminal domain-containing protein, partial [Pseudomonadota bacterium]|nr:DNA polymerase III subunit gamma/tau C-terminal domain-containing protein [Pseudomonadota bacterium]